MIRSNFCTIWHCSELETPIFSHFLKSQHRSQEQKWWMNIPHPAVMHLYTDPGTLAFHNTVAKCWNCRQCNEENRVSLVKNSQPKKLGAFLDRRITGCEPRLEIVLRIRQDFEILWTTAGTPGARERSNTTRLDQTNGADRPSQQFLWNRVWQPVFTNSSLDGGSVEVWRGEGWSTLAGCVCL
jgi:hypothetical protein